MEIHETEFEGEGIEDNNSKTSTEITRRGFLKVSAATAAIAAAMVSGIPGIGIGATQHETDTVMAAIDTVVPGTGTDPNSSPGAIDVPPIVSGVFAALTGSQITAVVSAIDSQSLLMYGNDFLHLNLAQRTAVFNAMQTNATLKTIITKTTDLYYQDKAIGEQYTYQQISYPGWVWGYKDWACKVPGSQGPPWLPTRIGDCRKF